MNNNQTNTVLHIDTPFQNSDESINTGIINSIQCSATNTGIYYIDYSSGTLDNIVYRGDLKIENIKIPINTKIILQGLTSDNNVYCNIQISQNNTINDYIKEYYFGILNITMMILYYLIGFYFSYWVLKKQIEKRKKRKDLSSKIGLGEKL